MVDPFIAVIISIPLVLLLLAIGVPVFASLGLVGFMGCAAISSWDMALAQLKVFPYVQSASYLLVVIPLFVIMGHFAFKAGIGKDVYLIGRTWFSRFPAGLGVATIIGSAGFAACSGSSVATAATMGAVAIPEMREQGYDPKLACGIVAAGGVLGIMIPPSVILVFYGVITDTSVGAMLVAGVIPGIVSVIIYILGLTFLSKLDPSLAPEPAIIPWTERFYSLKHGVGAFILFLTVVGGIYVGWFTPTEAAAVGSFVAFLAMIFRRKQIGAFFPALKECFSATLRTSCMVLIVIGAATALALAAKGANVAVADLIMAEDTMAKIAAMSRKGIAIETNIAKADDVNKMVETAINALGHIDILVNNAGVVHRDSLLETAESTWDRVVDIILKGTFLCIQAIYPHMRERKYGKIINVSSISGIIGGAVSKIGDTPEKTSGRSGPAYAAAKGGVLALTRWIAKDIAKDGIYVNAIAPGACETEMTRGFDYNVDALPIPRMGQPQEMADAILFLASDISSYITGQVLNVDGGWVMS